MASNLTSEQSEKNQKEIKDLISQLTVATKDQHNIIDKYQKIHKQLRDENIQKEKEATKLREQVEFYKKKVTVKSKETLKPSDKDAQTDLQKELSRTKNKLEETEKAKCEFQIKVAYLETEVSNLRRTLKEKEDQIEQLNKQRGELQTVERRLQDTLNRQNIHSSETLRKIEQERDGLKQQIDNWVKQKHTTVHVQMYAAVNRELCEKMMNELEAMLSLQFELNNSLIQVEKYKQPPDDSPLPLLVLCINASRLGTDVNQALHNVSRTRTVAVIVLHHKEMHALPRQPSEKLLIGSDYKHIGLIVDIAYLTTKGIYPCDMNEKSLDRLVDFIKSNFKT